VGKCVRFCHLPEIVYPDKEIEIFAKFVLESLVMEYSAKRKSREEQPEITEKFIDIRRVFSAKNPRLAKSLPGFIFRILERIIHQDGINDFMF
jgi:hypothetical protein